MCQRKGFVLYSIYGNAKMLASLIDFLLVYVRRKTKSIKLNEDRP